MKKIFSVIVLTLTLVLLVGCGDLFNGGLFGGDFKEVELTNEEKLQLIQDMDAPEAGLFHLASEFNVTGNINDEDLLIKQKSDFYGNVDNDEVSFLLYATMDLELKIQELDMAGELMLFLQPENLYLETNVSLRDNNLTIAYDAREVMPIAFSDEDSNLLEIDVSDFWQEFQNLDYEDLVALLDEEVIEKLMNFITIYKNGDKVRVEVSVDKEGLLALFSGDQPDVVTMSFSDNTKIELVIDFENKQLSTIRIDFKLGLDYEDEYQKVKITAGGFIGLTMNVQEPSLPEDTELDQFEEVEYFGIFEDILGGMLPFEF